MSDDEAAAGAGADASADVQRLAHDLLQSIGIIQAVTATIRAEASGDAAVWDCLAHIEREARTMAAMCEQQLRQDLHLAPFDVSAVVGRVIDRISLSHRATIDADVEPCDLVGDAVAWERALFNVIENGCRAAGPDGKVEVVARRRDGSISVKVGDSGPGFGRTQRGRASLGLVSVAELVDAHSGHVELRRSPLGGAELTIVVTAERPPPSN